jgi:hypothetical protein
LVESWDLRNWPVKDALIESLTSPEHPPLDTCGNGGILKYLKADGYHLEISQYAVNRLRGEGLTMHQGRLPRLPLPDTTYDVVVASQVLEHPA